MQNWIQCIAKPAFSATFWVILYQNHQDVIGSRCGFLNWIGVLAALVLLSGTGYFWVSQKMEWGWQKNTAEVVTSPDGQWRASLIFAEPGSAFGGMYNEVTLDRVGGVPSIWLPFRQVFISSLSEGPLNTVMDWSRDGVLQIAYPDDVDVLKHSTTFDGVKLEYQSEHLGRPNTAILAAN